jgi:hypothetical protein
MGPPEVFTDFTASQLQQGHLKYLNATNYLKKGDSFFHLPSWVPDWTRQADRRSFECFPVKHFQASRDSMPRLRINSDAKILSIEGFICGKIQKIAPKTPAEYSNDNFGLLAFYLVCHVFAFSPWKISEDFKRLKAYFAFLGVLSSEIRLPHPAKSVSVNHVPKVVRESYLGDGNPAENNASSSPRDEIVRVSAGTVTELKEFKDTILEFSEHRRLYSISRRGHRFVGWAASCAAVGDIVCIFKGANVPHLLRDNGNGSFELLEECYLQDHMRSGAMGIGLEERTFHIS